MSTNRTEDFIQALRAESGQPYGCPICGGSLAGTTCEDCGTDFEKAAAYTLLHQDGARLEAYARRNLTGLPQAVKSLDYLEACILDLAAETTKDQPGMIRMMLEAAIQYHIDQVRQEVEKS